MTLVMVTSYATVQPEYVNSLQNSDINKYSEDFVFITMSRSAMGPT